MLHYLINYKHATLCLIMIVISLPSFANKKVKLLEAIEKNIISAEIIPQSKNGIFEIEFSFKNNLNENIDIEIESGRKLIPLGKSYQNLMITQSSKTTLFAKIKRKIKLFGMCINAHKSSPLGVSMKLGKFVDPELMQMAKMIEKQKIQSLEGQRGVWVISDNNYFNEKEYKNLSFKSLIKKLMHIKPIICQGKIDFQIQSREKLYFDVYSQNASVRLFTADSCTLNAGSYHRDCRFKIDRKYFNSHDLKVVIRNSQNENLPFWAYLKEYSINN